MSVRAFRKQTLGANRQDDHQQHEGDQVLVVRREIEATEGLGQTDDQAADDGAGKLPMPPRMMITKALVMTRWPMAG